MKQSATKKRPVYRQTYMILALLAFVCTTGQVHGQDSQVDAKIDEFLSHLQENDQFMGSVTVLQAGKTLHNKAYGLVANGNEPIPANVKTKYRIGSVTKTFTSVMILQLVEAGQLKLDDKLETFFPKVANAKSITIDQMLLHRSGLGSITADPDYLTWSTSEVTRSQLMEKVYSMPTRFEPDAKMEYSNTNYILLGFIIEEITKQTYADSLQEKICEPLGLQNTYYGKKISAADNEATSFKFDGQDWVVESETDMSVPHGAGAIVSTSEDLTTFHKALFNEKLVTAKTLALMKQQQEGMGRGLFSLPFGGKSAFGHNGGIDGFQSNLFTFPDDDVVVCVLGNGIVYPLNDVMLGILSRTFDVPHELPSFEIVEIAVEKLQRYEGVYSADGFPLKVTVKVEGTSLMAQATGQSAFPLTANSETEFSFQSAAIKMEFRQSTAGGEFDQFRFQQGGNDLIFEKE